MGIYELIEYRLQCDDCVCEYTSETLEYEDEYQLRWDAKAAGWVCESDDSWSCPACVAGTDDCGVSRERTGS